MAKAGLAEVRNADLEAAWRRQLGAALKRAVDSRGWTLKEFAAKVHRDPRQCAKWFDGSDRQPLDVLFAVEDLRVALLVELVPLAGSAIEVSTHFVIRRPA